MEEGTVKFVDVLLFEAIHLEERCDRDHIDAAIKEDVDRHLAKFELNGIDVSPAHAREKITDELERRYDEDLQSKLLQHDADRRATIADLEQNVAKSRKAPDVKDDLHELVLHQRWRGRSVEEFATWIESRTEKDEPLLPTIFEMDPVRYFGLQVTGDSERDTAARSRISAVQHAWEDARQDTKSLELLEAIKRSSSGFDPRAVLTSEAKKFRNQVAGFRVARMRRSHATA
jgi:hypothetical protein